MEEAFAPLYASIFRTALLLLVGLLVSVAVGLVLARRMVTPIRALQAGAIRLGAGDLDASIAVHTRDELETLGDAFNHMAGPARSPGTMDLKELASARSKWAAG